MKISYCSDLHLESLLLSEQAFLNLLDVFHNAEKTDVLALVGDIIEARLLAASSESSKYIVKERCRKLFDVICSKYDHVIYVMGNHEHYRGYFNLSKGIIEKFVSVYDNCAVLENESLEINGVSIFGCTMWTDCGSPVDHWFIEKGMMDYKLIKYKTNSGARRLSVNNTIGLYINSRTLISNHVQEVQDRPCVILTHHAPHIDMLHDYYRQDSSNSLNRAFYSDMSDIMLDNPNIRVWVSGHTHNSTSITIGDTLSVSNALGYLGSEFRVGDIPSFQIKQIEV